MTDTAPHTEHLPEELTEWAERFNIGPDALFSLYQILTIPLGSAAVGEYEKNSETYVQNVLRVSTLTYGVTTWGRRRHLTVA